MKKNGSLALSLAFVAALGMGFTGCGSDAEDIVDAYTNGNVNGDDVYDNYTNGDYDDAIANAGTPGTAIFVYQHISQEACSRVQDLPANGMTVEVLEYSNTNKTCEDYGRVNDYTANLDDTNVCIEMDLGTSSSGSCVVNAENLSSYGRSRTYTTPNELADTLINQ